MSNKVTRNYKGSDSAMLTAIDTIMEAALDYQDELVAKRANWAAPFFTNLKTGIDEVVQTYLGADSVKDLRNATITVTQVQAAALNNLEELKVQIERDFREDKITRDELLAELGYKEFFKAAQKKDQGALVEMLYRFKQGLTADVQAQLTAKGVDAGTLTAITGVADVLKNANVSQEAFKSSIKTGTEAAVTAFNEVYNDVMDVAVIAATIFKKDKAKKERFSYSKTLKAQQAGKTTGKEIPAGQPALTPA